MNIGRKINTTYDVIFYVKIQMTSGILLLRSIKFETILSIPRMEKKYFSVVRCSTIIHGISFKCFTN